MGRRLSEAHEIAIVIVALFDVLTGACLFDNLLHQCRELEARDRLLGKAKTNDGRLNDSKQVRQLPMLLGNAQATEVLDERGYVAAARVLASEDPAMGSELYDAVKRATDQLTKAPADEIRDLALIKQKLLMLRNLRHAIEDLATLADVKL
jgi:hypothetical protein